VQDRGGGLAFEKEFERRPDQFPGSDNQRPAPAQVARLASLGSGTVCLVAAAPADPQWLAAEARCVRIDAETAELGLTGRRGRLSGRQGWGTCCWKHWCCAREEGIKRLRAVVLLEDTPMLCVLQRYGWVLAAPTDPWNQAPGPSH